jgi:hypothetical protein
MDSRKRSERASRSYSEKHATTDYSTTAKIVNTKKNININKINNHNQPAASIQYETDEDELPKEVERITASSGKNKKRKINLSPDRRMNSKTPQQIK